ncbi:MAG: hypothetical protein AAF581_07340 [Planctomycetota bacterium]
MKRVLLLVAVLGVCLTAIVFSLILLPGTGAQLALRLDNAWEAGELQASEPRMTDVDTVSFQTVTMRSTLPVADDRRSSLVLHDVDWQRGTLLSLGRRLDVAKSSVRFGAGKLGLHVAGRWGTNPLWPGLDDDVDWPSRLPHAIRGDSLDILLSAALENEVEVELAVTAVNPRLEAASRGGGVLTAELDSPWWGTANLEWRFRTARSGFHLHVDDADLAVFPFVGLARVFDFPWPVDMPSLSGRADLDWSVQGGRPTLQVQHYQLDVGLAELPHRLHYLTGEADVTPESVDWTVSSGRYSQSRFTAQLRIDRGTRRVTGEARIQDVLGDRGIGAGLPKAWFDLLQRIPLAGRCDMEVELDGFVGLQAREVIRSLTLRFGGVEVRNNLRAGGASGLAGEFVLRPVTGGWQLTGTSAASQLHGFHIPASEWAGSLDREGLRMARVGDDGPKVAVECHLEDDAKPTYSIYVEDFALSDWLDRKLGAARGSMYVGGSWDIDRGFTFDGWCNWAGVEVPAAITWPFRRPLGEVSGQLLFRRHRGQDYLPAIAVQDDAGVWVAHGWIDPRRQWTLDGVATEYSGRLPTPLEIPSLVEDPREGWHSYRLEGVLLDWRVAE